MTKLEIVPTEASGGRNKASENVLARIKGLIVDKGYGPGVKLPSEHQLAAQLGVSRNTVRGAMHTLAAMGLVDTRHGARPQVAMSGQDMLSEPFHFLFLLDRPSYLEMHEVRTGLEVQAAGCAAERRTEEELRALDTTLQEMYAHTDDDQTRALNRRFHLEVALAAHNSVIERVLSSLHEVRAVYFNVTGIRALPERNEFHARIVEGVRRGDAGEARAAMTADMQHALDIWISHQPPVAPVSSRVREDTAAD